MKIVHLFIKRIKKVGTKTFKDSLIDLRTTLKVMKK